MVSSKWRQIGIRTGQTDHLNEYATKALHDANQCCERVFRVWILKGGHPPRYPLTWQGLYDLLCDIGCNGIANEMADVKEIGVEKRPLQTSGKCKIRR